MCEHPLHAPLATSRACLGQGLASTGREPMSVDSLRCAVRQTRQLTTQVARLADALADRLRSDVAPAGLRDRRARAAPVDQTVREITEDLRTMSRHLTAAHLLLEPADADLEHLTTGAGPDGRDRTRRVR